MRVGLVKHPGLLLLALFCASGSIAKGQGIITTIAGTEWVFPGDGRRAVEAPIGRVTSVAADLAGNVYVADPIQHLVHRIDRNGILRVVAGNGIVGSSGDGGPATQATLVNPVAIALDPQRNLYISDSGAGRIRMVSPEGIITTVAGTGLGFSPDGTLARNARLSTPRGLAIDSSGTIYFAETAASRVRRITPDGILTTVAGNGVAGFSGDGGPAIEASFREPWDVALDSAGNRYISDSRNFRVRRVTPDGVVRTFAGGRTSGFPGDGGPAVDARIDLPTGVAVDAGNSVYIVGKNDRLVRKVTPDGLQVGRACG